MHAAFAQKVSALALREQVQSRDVFDLKLLLDAGGAGATTTRDSSRPSGHRNRQCAWPSTIDAFAGQVLAYLEPEYQEHYRTKKAWNELQEQVVNGLEALEP